MEELSECTSQIVEFKPTPQIENHKAQTDVCCGTDALPVGINVTVETTPKMEMSTQTVLSAASQCANVDENKLASWLRRIYVLVEEELKKGPTPILENQMTNVIANAEESNVLTYQKISIGALENSQGIATWLCVHTNNAPILVVSAIAPHDDWCDHLQQKLKLFVPLRLPTSNFIIFTEMKSVPLKACLKSLTTNRYNKSMFSGSTLDGEIHVWLYKSGLHGGEHEVDKLFSVTSEHDYAVALDWADATRLFTFHANGYVVSWTIGKEMLKDNDYNIQPPNNGSNEITAAICLNSNGLVVGTKDGGVYLITLTGVGAFKRKIEITVLKRHLFMVSTLVRAFDKGHRILISCDLSGEVSYHDWENIDDDNTDVIVQFPLPFKNVITCSNDASVLYAPGINGSLECFYPSIGLHTIVKGALNGRGNFIKSSDNGYWIITGLYKDDFQIFFVDE